MKKILTLLLLIVLFFSSGYRVSAQGQKIDPLSEFISESLKEKGEVPGITCGDASNPKIQQCCKATKQSTNLEIEDPRFLCIPFGGPCFSSIPVETVNKFINKSSIPGQVEKLNELAAQQTGCIVGSPDKPGSEDCTCKPSALTKMCERYLSENPSEKSECLSCTAQDKGIWTGLGCINVSVAGFAESLMSLGTTFAGLIALLCIIYSAFVLQTSAGNPERVKKAREYLTNCIIGLLLIIFSVFILRVIGVNILRIPGFI